MHAAAPAVAVSGRNGSARRNSTSMNSPISASATNTGALPRRASSKWAVLSLNATLKHTLENASPNMTGREGRTACLTDLRVERDWKSDAPLPDGAFCRTPEAASLPHRCPTVDAESIMAVPLRQPCAPHCLTHRERRPRALRTDTATATPAPRIRTHPPRRALRAKRDARTPRRHRRPLSHVTPWHARGSVPFFRVSSQKTRFVPGKRVRSNPLAASQ